MKPRYQCCDCTGFNIQISFPAWFRAGTLFEMEFVEADAEATPRFYCEDCGDEPSDVLDHAED